jgi:four helix bundle protein
MPIRQRASLAFDMQPGPIRTYKDLVVWQRAIELVVAVHRLVGRIPVPERYDFASQMRRAARSVSANIAEGFGRDHLGDYLRSLSAARASVFELESDLLVLRALSLTAEDDLHPVTSLADQVGRMLTAQAKKLRARRGRKGQARTFFDDDHSLGPRT